RSPVPPPRGWSAAGSALRWSRRRTSRRACRDRLTDLRIGWDGPRGTRNTTGQPARALEAPRRRRRRDRAVPRFDRSDEPPGAGDALMLYEISRTTPLAQVELFPQAHRNMAEALESLARHGYHGTRAGQRLGPLRVVVQWGVRLVARYLVVSYIRNLVKQIRNLYVMREIQSVIGTRERLALTRARSDAEQMLEALKTNEVAVPTFLIGGALIPVVAALGRANGLLDSTAWATAFAVGGVVVALVASWFILRGAAL